MILPPKIADWPIYWQELWAERAAIMEFDCDGKLARESAEFWAERDIRQVAANDLLAKYAEVLYPSRAKEPTCV